VTAGTGQPLLFEQDDIDIVRLIARCYTNGQIAAILRITPAAVRQRLHTIYVKLHIGPDLESAPIIARCRIIAWAYESGLVQPGEPAEHIVTPPQPEPERGRPPLLPKSLAHPLLELCRAIVEDRPRGDLRKHATQALHVAETLSSTTDKPSRRANAA
jgi:DNA-binding CsgD family transcriptional regulator